MILKSSFADILVTPIDKPTLVSSVFAASSWGGYAAWGGREVEFIVEVEFPGPAVVKLTLKVIYKKSVYKAGALVNVLPGDEAADGEYIQHVLGSLFCLVSTQIDTYQSGRKACIFESHHV